MVILPISKKLRKKVHRDIALAQDILVMGIYDVFPQAVIHGGTAIWRCYNSNRFSEDVDIYLPPDLKKSDLEKLKNRLERSGFRFKKFKKTNGSIFAKLTYLNVKVRFEAVLKNVKNFITKNFEMSDGSFILVNTLKPEDIICDKVSAYLKRKKIRDLYDIFFLLKFVRERKKIRNVLKKLLKEFSKPKDEKELKTLIIVGSIPTVENMIEVIKRWAKQST